MRAPIESLPDTVLGAPGTWALIRGTQCFEGGLAEGWIVRAYHSRLAWTITVMRACPYGKAIFTGPSLEEAQRRGLADLATLLSVVAPTPTRQEPAPTVHLHQLASDVHQIIRDDDGEVLGELTCSRELAQSIADAVNAAGPSSTSSMSPLSPCEDCAVAAVIDYQGSPLCEAHARDAGAAKCESCARLFDSGEEGVGSIGPDCLDFCGPCWAEMQAEDDAGARADQTAALASPATPQVVIDILGLACRYATPEDVAGWSEEQREAAINWAACEHAAAAVEEPPFPETVAPPDHVAALPEVIDQDPPSAPGGRWSVRLRFADGREETRERFPGEGLA